MHVSMKGVNKNNFVSFFRSRVC